MSKYTVICQNCNTKVARTPNGICVNCGALHWKKVKNKFFSFTSIISISLCFIMLVMLFIGFLKSKNIQHKKEQYYSINHVQFGLFSIKEWKSKVADVLIKKIDEFELTGENRGKIKQMIEHGLNKVVHEIKTIIQRKKNENFWGGLIISFIEEFAISIEDFEREIPYLTESIMRDLDSQQNQTDLKILIKQKLIEYLDRTIQDEDYSKVDELLSSIECDTKIECNTWLISSISNQTKQLVIYIIICLILFVSIALLSFYASDILSVISYIIGSSTLLIGGISFPMIDIDARIEHFHFSLIGEPLSFNNQILFFQSKSIVDVVTILFKNNAFDSILVAFLILLFSILFPLTKIISSCIYLFKRSIANNKLLSFMIFKSAKWSMADVLVVAIFMAFIGFESILNNQLSHVNQLKSNVEILTMDNTTFQYGFLLFLLFTLSSLFMPYYLKSIE